MNVYIEQCQDYDSSSIDNIVSSWRDIFSNAVKPGDSVVLKPNWIAETHKYNEGEWLQVVTHPRIIEGVLKVILDLLDGKGKVTITDGPMTGSSWKKLMEIMQPDRWIEMGKCANIDVSVLDLRDHEWTIKGDIIVERKELQGDPLGSVICNLSSRSEFVGKDVGKLGFFGADYNQQETNEAHSGGKHLYKVSRTVLEADVFINLPKLKTHKKSGVTCSLKNLVGINTYKNWLPHHTNGAPSEGGDQFPEKSIRSFAEGRSTKALYDYLAKHPHMGKFFITLKKFGKLVFGDTRKTIRSGSWYGNDTLWRMVLDLNKILFYANTDGSLRDDVPDNRKRYISLVDAVISGDGNGPDAPNRKDTGILIIGTDPVSVDCVCAKIMGFDWQKIPITKNSFGVKNFPSLDSAYEDILVKSSLDRYNKPLCKIKDEDSFCFEPSVGWKGHVESAFCLDK